MNRWIEFDLAEIFRNFEIWVSGTSSPFDEKLGWTFQIRWPGTDFNLAPEFENKVYMIPLEGLEDVRDWIRNQQPIRNPDERLRDLERQAATGDRRAWMRWYYELERVGQLESFIRSFADVIADVAIDLQTAITDWQGEFSPILDRITIEGRTGPIMVTTPPPFMRALQFVELNDENSYYISPHSHHAAGVGYGEIGASELAMHLGVADNEILQFCLQGGFYDEEDRLGVRHVIVESISAGGELVISEGSPSEILSTDIRRQIGWDDPQIPELTPEHQPMTIYKLLITDHQGIYRARIIIYHYLRDNIFYRRWESGDYERHRLLPIIDQVLIEQHGYLEA